MSIDGYVDLEEYTPVPSSRVPSARSKSGLLFCQPTREQHDLRHTCASSLVAGLWGRTWRLEVVREVLGHSGVDVTERYAHLSASVIQEAANDTPGNAVVSRDPIVIPRHLTPRHAIGGLRSPKPKVSGSPGSALTSVPKALRWGADLLQQGNLMRARYLCKSLLHN